MTGKSFLVLSINRERRTYVAEALRPNGDVIVEAMTLGQAEGILRQLRFDALAIDFVGLGAGVLQFLDDLRVDHPETRVVVVGPPVDPHILARLRRSTLRVEDHETEPTLGANEVGRLLSMNKAYDASRLCEGPAGLDVNVGRNVKHNATKRRGKNGKAACI